MSIFRRPDYKSDATQFIDQLKAQRPELDEQQRSELDQEKRIDLLIEQSNIVNDEAAAGILVFRRNIMGSNPRVRNFFPNGYSTFWSLPYMWIQED